MIKKGKQSVTKQLETWKMSFKKFCELNQWPIFHGFAVTLTEAK